MIEEQIFRNEIRAADAKDYLPLLGLLKSVNLPTQGVKKHLQHFKVMVIDETLVGTVGLEIYGRKALLRSLAVVKEHQGKGYGNFLYQAILTEALQKNISELFLLTETAQTFFAARGFKAVSREQVDRRVKTSREFLEACPESAVCMHLKL